MQLGLDKNETSNQIRHFFALSLGNNLLIRLLVSQCIFTEVERGINCNSQYFFTYSCSREVNDLIDNLASLARSLFVLLSFVFIST